MTSDDRWLEASRLADEAVSVQTHPVRTGRTGAAIATTVVLLLAVLGGYGVTFWPESGDHSWSRDVQRVILAEDRLLSVLIIGCIFVGVVMMTMSHSIPWRLISGALSFSEWRDVQRQISGDNLVAETKLPLIVMMAKQHHTVIGSLAPIYVAAVLATVRWAVLSDRDTVHYWSVGITAALMVIGVWMLSTYLRADAFIENHEYVEYQPTSAPPQ
jgi:hypothetical protein